MLSQPLQQIIIKAIHRSLPVNLPFTGNGGVGKTSISCATAIRLAGQGKRVLLVSTNPASSVGQVFGQTIGNTVQPIASTPGLSALRQLRSNIGQESLTQLKGAYLMTLLAASTNNCRVHVQPRLLHLMSLPDC